uniref:Uncharacterized protein n=1 Tax=Arundo donax TaxID=35708 RepID=A0A0A9GZH9_ARUDO
MILDDEAPQGPQVQFQLQASLLKEVGMSENRRRKIVNT